MPERRKIYYSSRAISAPSVEKLTCWVFFLSLRAAVFFFTFSLFSSYRPQRSVKQLIAVVNSAAVIREREKNDGGNDDTAREGERERENLLVYHSLNNKYPVAPAKIPFGPTVLRVSHSLFPLYPPVSRVREENQQEERVMRLLWYEFRFQ